MKEKIVKELKNKYSNLGLGEKALNGVASFLEKTVTTEDDIANAVAGENVKALLVAIQGETDSLRGQKAAAEKALNEFKGAQQSSDTVKDDVAKMLEQMRSEQEAMKAELAASKKQARDTEIIKGVREKMRANGSDNDFILNLSLKGIEVGDADTVETLADKYKSVYDENYKAAYGSGAVPPSAQRRQEGYKKGDFKEVTEMLKSEGLIPQGK